MGVTHAFHPSLRFKRVQTLLNESIFVTHAVKIDCNSQQGRQHL